MRKDYPFYDLVPKERAANLEFREKLLAYGEDGGPDAQDEIWDMCSRDCLFFVNAFGYLIEPRDESNAIIPWITYEQQDEAYDELNWAWGKKDICIFKCRDAGGTWIVITESLRRYNFGERESILLLSRNENLVDAPGDWDALFQKIDFLRDNLPGWLVCDEHRISLHRENLERHNIIDGESTNKSATTGKRRRMVFFDELARMDRQADHWASAGAVTNCRIACFTPWYDAHYARGLSENENLVQIPLDWERDPRKSPGLYRSDNGVVEIIDKDYPFPADYPFVLDGELRSVWWDDFEKNRAQSKSEMDLLYRKRWVGGEIAWFDHEAIRQYERDQASEPWLYAELSFDAERPHETAQLRQTPGGRWWMWLNLTAENRPPADDYVVGCDVATGTVDLRGRGASNSSLTVMRRRTCETVAELTVGGVDAQDFARMALATCGLFRSWGGKPALLKWEKGGAGSTFGKEVIRQKYPWEHIYWRKLRPDSIRPDESDEPGWAPSQQARFDLLHECAVAIHKRGPTIRSKPLLREMKDYIHGKDGYPEHMSTIKTSDPTNVRANHGDRVVGFSMAWSECDRDGRAAISAARPELPPDTVLTMAGRRMRRQRRLRDEKSKVDW